MRFLIGSVVAVSLVAIVADFRWLLRPPLAGRGRVAQTQPYIEAGDLASQAQDGASGYTGKTLLVAGELDWTSPSRSGLDGWGGPDAYVECRFAVGAGLPAGVVPKDRVLVSGHYTGVRSDPALGVNDPVLTGCELQAYQKEDETLWRVPPSGSLLTGKRYRALIGQ